MLKQELDQMAGSGHCDVVRLQQLNGELTGIDKFLKSVGDSRKRRDDSQRRRESRRRRSDTS